MTGTLMDQPKIRLYALTTCDYCQSLKRMLTEFAPGFEMVEVDVLSRDERKKTIEELETERDVIFVIITDGDENTSREYTKEAVNKMIDTLTKEEGWKFLFLAANQDTIAAGGSIGISASNSMTYAATTAGAQNSWTAFSANTSYYRSVKNMAVNTVGTDSMDLGTLSSNIGFSDTQRNDSI